MYKHEKLVDNLCFLYVSFVWNIMLNTTHKPQLLLLWTTVMATRRTVTSSSSRCWRVWRLSPLCELCSSITSQLILAFPLPCTWHLWYPATRHLCFPQAKFPSCLAQWLVQYIFSWTFCTDSCFFPVAFFSSSTAYVSPAWTVMFCLPNIASGFSFLLFTLLWYFLFGSIF